MSTKRARFLLICSLAFCLQPACEADVMYTFDYTALSGPVQSFEFSLTAPSFVTGDSSPVLTPFTPTDGTNSWAITNDLVRVFGPANSSGTECFMFGTAFATLSGPPPFSCGVGVGGPGVNQGGFLVAFTGVPLPAGIYAAQGFGGAFDTAAGFENIGSNNGQNPTGSMVLTIASVPEPESLGLVAIGLAVLWGSFSKKAKRSF